MFVKSNYGYDLYFSYKDRTVTLPITPSEINMTIGSNNKTLSLIDEGEINLLKSPKLREVSFEALFPAQKYPFARDSLNFQEYWEFFKKLKNERSRFRFIVARKSNIRLGINLLVSLEELASEENAEKYGEDILLSFKLKEAKEYGVRVLETGEPETTSTSEANREDFNRPDNASQTYIVREGDCLWTIAQKFYANGSDYPIIYEANQDKIEKDAKRRGKESSSYGHWIYPGLELRIPAK